MSPDEEANKDQNSNNVAVEEAPPGSSAEEEVAATEAESPDADAAGTEGTGPAEGDTEDRGSVKKAEFQDVANGPEKGEKPGMDLLMNVTLPVSVELGRATMTIQEVLGIYEGSVIELERVAGEPVDILVSGKLLGKGEVVVVDDKFGIRITELINRVEGIEQ